MLDARLAGREYVALDEYTIADIAIFCWVARHERHRIALAEYPNVKAWFERIGARPAVMRGMAVIKPGHDDRPRLNPARLASANRASSA